MQLVNEIIESLDTHPDEWAQGRHTILHRPTGIEVWTSNGFWFLSVHRPQEIPFSYLEKHRMSRAIRRWRGRIRMVDLATKPETRLTALRGL